MRRFLLVLFAFNAALALAHGDGDWPRRSDDDAHLPRLIDARGHVVGPLKNFGGAEGVFLDIDGAPVFVPVEHRLVSSLAYSSTEFEWLNKITVYYSSTDCAGEVLIVDPAVSPRPAVVVRNGTDVTLYVAGNGASSDAQIHSAKTQDTSSATTCDSPIANFDSPAWTAPTTFSLTEHYPEPLRVAF
jgi:hypothetical protein